MLFTNNSDIPLPLAVWLASDDYDFVAGVNRVSATSLLKPIRRFILANRVPIEERDYDIADMINIRMGHAFHDSIEGAWLKDYRGSLRKLGYPEKVIRAIKINPDPATVQEGDVPVYLERRNQREINGFTVSGKFDMCIEGELFDTKSTSVYAQMKGSKDEDYIRQGSIYKWINPDIITGDHIHIQHIFTDWSRARAKTEKDYPPSRMANYTLELMSMEDTEKLIISKINDIVKYAKAPDAEIPYCTDEELWRSEPVYRYYSNPDKTDGRSTRNFDNAADANRFRAEKGKGVVITKLGEPKACQYCNAFPICEQRKQMNVERD